MEHNLRAAALFIFFISISLSQVIAGVYSGSSSASKLIPAVEVDALLVFKTNYIAKGSQGMLWSWNSSSTTMACESWVGITCSKSDAYHHIHGINLSSFGLAGSLAPHLGNLSFLSILDLANNSFTGSIPSQLQGCTSLIHLNLRQNSLTSIPFELGMLQQLYVLALGQNNLTGAIPPSIANCTSLAYIDLSMNQLTGPLPSEIGFFNQLGQLYTYGNNLIGAIPPNLSNCINLTYLELFDNKFSGPIPSELGMLQQLGVLALGQNNLTGAIPPSLGNCTSLYYLTLSFAQLTGPVPSELGFLINLYTLYLGGNSLTGVIPPSLGNCTKLDGLDFTFNRLTGPIPAELGFLSKLSTLFINVNNLTGAIPPSLGMCANLAHLQLAYNQLTGPIPSELGHLSSLEDLMLHGNLLSGMLPWGLSNCTNLLKLVLGENRLSGSLFQLDFSNFPALQLLYLRSNHFTGEIPWHPLTNSTYLFQLDLSNNHLNGEIPASLLGKFPGLRILHLQGNVLQGEIPNSPDNYTALTLLDVDFSFNQLNGSLPLSLARAFSTLTGSLNLSHNQLSGSLPIWLGQMIQVQAIDLSHNSFLGSIPESLGNCADLFTLNLSENHLSGELPLQLGRITTLEFLDLSYNNFSGVLPSYLGTTLHNLQFLNVSFNNLSGPIPTDQGVFRHLNASSFQGNPGLCGPILRKECTGLQVSEEKKHHHHHSVWHLRIWRIIIIIALSLLVVLVMLLLIVWRYRLLRCDKMASMQFIGKLAGTTRYSDQELMEATQGYSKDNLLGEGGISAVYKGVLTNGKIVAVKKMKDAYDGSHEALLREMQTLSKLRHRNLVQVLGCVLNLDVKALVLEYMANGSLEHYLNVHQEHTTVFEEMDSCGLSYWEMVTRVAISIANALAYLHHEYDVPIIHGDVKPSNILLDSDMEPHLADFGLAKLINRGAEAVSLTSNFKGSIGYMAPEYALAARITTKVDVYAYGVVLLVMLTGRTPTQIIPDGLSLHEWVKSKLPSKGYDVENIEEVLDTSLFQSSSNIIETSTDNHPIVVNLLRMGLACTEDLPNDRPTIREVLSFLTSASWKSSQQSLNSLDLES